MPQGWRLPLIQVYPDDEKYRIKNVKISGPTMIPEVLWQLYALEKGEKPDEVLNREWRELDKLLFDEQPKAGSQDQKRPKRTPSKAR